MFKENVNPIIEKLFSECDCAIAFVRKDNEAVIALNGNTDNILGALAESIVRFTDVHKKDSSSIEGALRETQLLLSIKISKLMQEKLKVSTEKQFH